jgi:hypothetical protein
VTDTAQRIDEEPVGRHRETGEDRKDRGHAGDDRAGCDHAESIGTGAVQTREAGLAVGADGTDGGAVSDLPDPGETARSLALCVAEILTGAREVDTISRWITDEVHRHLQHRAAVAARARSVSRHAHRRAVIRVGGVVLDRPRDDVVEAAVVVHTRSRARAVAIRLEPRNGRWRATAIGVL